MNSSDAATRITPSVPVNYGPQLNTIVWAFTGLSAVFLGLRIYSKLLRQCRLRWDDLVLTVGWVALAFSSVLLSVSISYGMGQDTDSINKQTFAQLIFFQIASGFATIVATGLSKSSFAMTLLSIMPVISDTEGRKTRMLVWFVLISINAVLGALGTLQWVQCWPPEKAWRPETPGSCSLQGEVTRNFGTFASAYSGSADIVLALIPWKIIYRAKIRRKEKMGALFAMSMGVLYVCQFVVCFRGVQLLTCFLLQCWHHLLFKDHNALRYREP